VLCARDGTPPPAPPIDEPEEEPPAEPETEPEPEPAVDPPPTAPAVPEEPPAGPAVPEEPPAGPAVPEEPPTNGPTAPEQPPAGPVVPEEPPAEPAAPVDPPAEPAAPVDPPTEPEAQGVDVYAQWLQCGPGERRIRKEVMAMTDVEWGRFLNALNQLKNNPEIRSRRNPDFSPFEDLASLHTEFVEEAHGGAYFLPWHRLFLFLLESQLREIDPSVTLPYWNWSVERNDNAAMASVWNRLGFSWFTAQNPGCVENGPWAGWWTRHPHEHCLRRGFRSGPGGTFPPLESWGNIRNLINSDSSYSRLATTIEALHGSAHVGVGGDMAVLGTAPNDPVFFMHHAFVDYIWYRWQRNGRGGRMRFSGTHPTLNGTNARRVDRLEAFNKQVREGMGLGCVIYEDSPRMQIFNAQPVQGRTSNDRSSSSNGSTVLWTDATDDKASNWALVDAEQAAEAQAFMAELSA